MMGGAVDASLDFSHTVNVYLSSPDAGVQIVSASGFDYSPPACVGDCGNPGTPTVPEPSVFLVGLVLLGGLVAVRRPG